MILRLKIYFYFIFFILFSRVGFANDILDYVVAQVNNDIILASELQSYINIQSYIQQDITNNQLVVDDLIIRKLQLDLANERGIKISDASINQRIELLAQAENTDIDTYMNRLQDFPGGVGGFSNYLRENSIIEELQRLELQSVVQVSEQEARRFLFTETGQELSQLLYTIGFIAIPKSASVSEQDESTIDEASTFLAGEADFFEQSQQILINFPKASYKKLSPEKLQKIPTLFTPHVPFMAAGEVVVLEDDTRFFLVKLLAISAVNPSFVEQVYARHILLKKTILRNIEQTYIEINNIRDRILAGESFATLARTYSEDVTTAYNGGILPWSAYTQFAPSFAEAVKNNSTGTIIGPIETLQGIHLIEILDKKNIDISEQVEILKIRNYIFQQKIVDELPRFLSNLRNAAFVVIR